MVSLSGSSSELTFTKNHCCSLKENYSIYLNISKKELYWQKYLIWNYQKYLKGGAAPDQAGGGTDGDEIEAGWDWGQTEAGPIARIEMQGK